MAERLHTHSITCHVTYSVLYAYKVAQLVECTVYVRIGYSMEGGIVCVIMVYTKGGIKIANTTRVAPSDVLTLIPASIL